jgi:16S rRNA (guanine527-N7)-methyltransferase
MVWAICRPDLPVTLLESVRKKCRALAEIASVLGLQNVSVVWGRSEEYALRARERYTFASARALAHAGIAAEYLSPLVTPGGRLAVFKGPKGPEETEETGGKWSRLGLSAPYWFPYGEDRDTAFVLWEKTAPCPSAYPRRPGLASSKNWWI